MINPNQTLTKLHYVNHSLIQTLINIISVWIDKEDFVYANVFISYLESSDIHEYYMYDKLTLVYDKAMLAYKKGDAAALNTLKKCKEVLIFWNCLKTANMVDQDLTRLLPTREKQWWELDNKPPLSAMRRFVSFKVEQKLYSKDWLDYILSSNSKNWKMYFKQVRLFLITTCHTNKKITWRLKNPVKQIFTGLMSE